jgi:hypothetical protein
VSDSLVYYQEMVAQRGSNFRVLLYHAARSDAEFTLCDRAIDDLRPAPNDRPEPNYLCLQCRHAAGLR